MGSQSETCLEEPGKKSQAMECKYNGKKEDLPVYGY